MPLRVLIPDSDFLFLIRQQRGGFSSRYWYNRYSAYEQSWVGA